ncbi:MAG TPA: CDP-alcohol phosphatidyltransferase family protein [Candidatus Binatia bacterium]|jgi:cardiolipin synthase
MDETAPLPCYTDGPMLNLPNFLTLIRILTIPFFLVYLAYHRYWEALIIFIVGGVTDFLDGLLARLMKQETPLGAYLDPVADKLLVFSSYTMLGLIDAIPTWLAVGVISRDVLLVLGYATIYFLFGQRFEIKPTRVGKASTMLQLLTLGVALGLLHNPELLPQWFFWFLIAATAVATLVSGIQYLYRGLVWLQSRAPSMTKLG